MNGKKKIYRYPGLNTFSYDERDIFFGRTNDKNKIKEYLSYKSLLIVHGRSGQGKSSLLHAGVKPCVQESVIGTPNHLWFGIPKIESTCCDILTIHGYNESSSYQYSFLDFLKGYDFDNNDLYKKLKQVTGDSLWSALKAISYMNPEKGFVIILDQFEQLFTYPFYIIDNFKIQISELLNKYFPEALTRDERQNFKTTELTEKEISFLYDPLPVKVIISLRSDKMYYLNRFTDTIPGITHDTYEIEDFRESHAIEAILKPAEKSFTDIFEFITPPFEYEKEALGEIVKLLKSQSSTSDYYNNEDCIDPGILQIICRHVEKMIVEKKNDTSISVDDLKESVAHLGDTIDAILENFYSEALMILSIPIDQFDQLRVTIEDGMINNGHRLPISKDQFVKNTKISGSILDELVEQKLFRSFQYESGVKMYELTHDILIQPILRAKSRREIELKKAAEKKSHVAEAKRCIRSHYDMLKENNWLKAKEYIDKAVSIYDQYPDELKAGVKAKICLVKVMMTNADNIGDNVEKRYEDSRMILKSLLDVVQGTDQQSLKGNIYEVFAFLTKDKAEQLQYLKLASSEYERFNEHNSYAKINEYLAILKDQEYDEKQNLRNTSLHDLKIEAHNFYHLAQQAYNLSADLIGLQRVGRALDRVGRFLTPWGYLVQLFTGEIHQLRGDSVIQLGRDISELLPDAHVTTTDIGFNSSMTFISRRHLTISPNLEIEDSKSLNGTTLNGKLIKYGFPEKFEDGDVFGVATIMPLLFLVHAPSVTAVPDKCLAIFIDSFSKKAIPLLSNVCYSIYINDGKADIHEGENMQAALLFCFKNGAPMVHVNEDMSALDFNEKETMLEFDTVKSIDNGQPVFRSLSIGKWSYYSGHPLRCHLIEYVSKKKSIIANFQIFIHPKLFGQV